MRARTSRSRRPRAGLVLCALFGAWGGACGGEAEPPQAHPFDGVNVLVTLFDAWAPGHVPAWGYERETMPFLGASAEEWVRCADVTAAAPYTLASVSSLFTGEPPDVHRVIHAGTALPDPLGTWAESFLAAGYTTHGISTNAHVHPRFGFDRGFERFEHVYPRVEEGEPHVVPDGMLREIEQFLDAEREAPFFAYWHFMPPHAPYAPPEPQRSSFAEHLADDRLGSIENLTPLTVPVREAGPQEQQSIVDLYDAGLLYVDAVIESLHADLEARGLLENTLWVLVSDHGEAFGQHGVFQHSRTLYQEMVQVPLYVRLPGGQRGGSVVEQALPLHGLYSSLHELFRLPGAPPSTPSFAGALLGQEEGSLGPIFSRTAGPGPLRSIRRGDLKLVHHTQNKRNELYDLARDPDERQDLAPRRAPAVQQLLADLERWKAAAEARAQRAQRVGLDPALAEALEAIGYGGEGEDAPSDEGD